MKLTWLRLHIFFVVHQQILGYTCLWSVRHCQTNVLVCPLEFKSAYEFDGDCAVITSAWPRGLLDVASIKQRKFVELFRFERDNICELLTTSVLCSAANYYTHYSCGSVIKQRCSFSSQRKLRTWVRVRRTAETCLESICFTHVRRALDRVSCIFACSAYAKMLCGNANCVCVSLRSLSSMLSVKLAPTFHLNSVPPLSCAKWLHWSAPFKERNKL